MALIRVSPVSVRTVIEREKIALRPPCDYVNLLRLENL
jgi:hypothetical protein